MNIQFDHVSKSYQSHTALQNLTFQLEGAKIVGLLGRNGAGKTTLLNMLAGCIFPDSGSILINGSSPFTASSVCLINEHGNFKKDFSVKEALKSASLFYPDWDHARAEELLDIFKLNRSKKINGLSKGMVSALGIVVGLSSKAPVTIFDEPYVGLDAAARSTFYSLLLDEFERNPRMFILSTHLIDEAAKLFEEVMIVHEGSLLLQKEAESLREESFSITGQKSDVTEYLDGKTPLHWTEFAGRVTAYVYGASWSREEAHLYRLETDDVPTQELMVHLTDSHAGGGYA